MTPKSGSEPTPIRIVADLQAMAGVELSFAHLPAGDYLVDACMLFERKTLTDLAESIKARRTPEEGSGLRGALMPRVS